MKKGCAAFILLVMSFVGGLLLRLQIYLYGSYKELPGWLQGFFTYKEVPNWLHKLYLFFD